VTPLYVVTTVFNPRRFRSRVRLYHHFARWLKSCGVQLVTAEVAFGDRPFECTSPDNPWDLQLRTTADLWHKERALNLAVAHLTKLVPGWEYVAWLDADVKLLRDDWAEEAVHLLQHYAVVQMFGEIKTLDPDHHTLYGGRSILRNFHDFGSVKNPKESAGWNGWPGLGYAHRRKEFEAVGGLLDVCVSGSGDTHMAGCFVGQPDLGMPPKCADGYRRAIRRYGELCAKHIDRNVSYLPGLLVHYWHGKASDRGYHKRWEMLARHQFDPGEDLVVDGQGLYRWRGNKPDLEYDIRRSMCGRNEDSVDV